MQADVIRKEIAIYSVRGHWLPYILCQKGTIMSEIKEYIIKIEVENEQNAHFETDIFGKDLDVMKEAVPRTISEICRDNGINGRISTRIEITADGEYFDSDEADLYAECDTIWYIETYLYNRGDVEKGSVHHDVITPEMLKRSMRIRSSIITGYPNPCAYTDRYQEEYNALAVYLAIHYPKDNRENRGILWNLPLMRSGKRLYLRWRPVWHIVKREVCMMLTGREVKRVSGRICFWI